MAVSTTSLFFSRSHFPLLFLLFYTAFAAQSPDLQPLLSFKSGADAAGKLTTWTTSGDPCSSSSPFYGVSCVGNRVSKLVLEDLSLSGDLQPLTSLSGLRVLSLSRNNLTGAIPDLSKLTSLKLLFLSHNLLSGNLPPSLSSLSRLYRLDLSYNNLSGQIPANVNRLNHLLTLRLEANALSGPISGLDLPNIHDFNASGNSLVGEIPKSLSAFPQSAFAGNPVLCGAPLSACKAVSTDPARPRSGAGDSGPSPVNPAVVVSSSPSSEFPPVPNKPSKVHHGSAKMSLVAIIAIVIGDVLILFVISILLYCYFWRSFTGKNSGLAAGEKVVYSNSAYPYPYPTTNPGQIQHNGLERGKMVFFEGSRKFELEDLLRASAEMLGKGVMGTAYKAVLDDGSVVAVKRLKLEAGAVGGSGGKLKGEFEQQMEVLGRLRNPNLVGLKAYYFARDEKLLVFDFMANGSLFWLLHGNRGPGRTPLDWTTRLKIASGAARGVAFIHSSCKPLKLTHGNIKSTNILIDKAGDARVSDFGLSSFVPPSINSSKTNGYRAPEVVDGRKITQKADVYSFGVLLLEILTGKCPSMVEPNGTVGMGGVVDLPRWVQSVVREEWTAEVFDLELMRYKDIEEEMVGLLQIAMACTATPPDQRPRMSHVVRMIDEIRGGNEISPSHDTTAADSADSPSASEETAGVSQ